MKVRFTATAESALEHIGDFIARDNPVRAVSFMAELRRKALDLAALPRGFPLVPRYERYGVRRRSYKGYGILYSLEGDEIIIHKFVGPGQDHDRLLSLN